MKFSGPVLACFLGALVAACSMPQTQTPTLPTGGGSSQDSSGSSGGQSSPGGSSSSSSESSQGSSGSQGSQGSSGSAGSQSSGGSMEGQSGSSSSGASGESAGGGGGLTVGEQLPWPSADMEAGGGGGLDQEFEDSLGDFDEAVAGEAGAAGSEEEIDILNPLGQGSSAAQSDEPVYEEGDLAEEGGMAENQSIAQRAATGGGEGSSSSGGGAEGGGSGEQSGGQQSESQAAAESGGGGAGALQGDRAVGAASAGAAMEGDEEIIPIPEDIGDGRNDDIVLRQIREAAMNERDPALREKLWDEYRRIRGAR